MMENQFPEKSLLIIIGELYVNKRILQDHIEILEDQIRTLEGRDNENISTNLSDIEKPDGQRSTGDTE
jgi:hypothetical protein